MSVKKYLLNPFKLHSTWRTEPLYSWMHKSNVKSESLLLSRKRAELLWKEQRFKPRRLCRYLQIDKNSFHVLGSQYQPQWVHIVLQEVNGKGIEILERSEQVTFCASERFFPASREFKHLQRQVWQEGAVPGTHAGARNPRGRVFPPSSPWPPWHLQAGEGARPPPVGGRSPLAR